MPGAVAVGVALTVTEIGLLVAGFCVAHGLAFELTTTVTTAPFVSELVVNVDPVCPPWFKPLICH